MAQDALAANAAASNAPGEKIGEPSLLNMYALALKEAGRFVEAARHYETALAMEPRNFILLLNAAATYAEVVTAPALRARHGEALARVQELYRRAVAANRDRGTTPVETTSGVADGLRIMTNNVQFFVDRARAGADNNPRVQAVGAELLQMLRDAAGGTFNAQFRNDLP